MLFRSPIHGEISDTVRINGKIIEARYHPDNNYVGADSFSYYVRDPHGARSLSVWFRLTIYTNIDSNRYRTFSQSDWDVASVKIPKKGVRPMPTTGNVLDTLFGTGSFRKLKDKTNPKYPGGMVLGVAQTVKDSMKS